jgi:hypothetical protein
LFRERNDAFDLHALHCGGRFGRRTNAIRPIGSLCGAQFSLPVTAARSVARERIGGKAERFLIAVRLHGPQPCRGTNGDTIPT